MLAMSRWRPKAVLSNLESTPRVAQGKEKVDSQVGPGTEENQYVILFSQLI
jgi:hypothetical protein